jgi:hypothetical protein
MGFQKTSSLLHEFVLLRAIFKEHRNIYLHINKILFLMEKVVSGSAHSQRQYQDPSSFSGSGSEMEKLGNPLNPFRVLCFKCENSNKNYGCSKIPRQFG